MKAILNAVALGTWINVAIQTWNVVHYGAKPFSLFSFGITIAAAIFCTVIAVSAGRPS